LFFKKWDMIIITPNLQVGGAEKVAVSLANEARVTSFDSVLVLSLNGAGKLRRKLDVGIAFIDLECNFKAILLLKLFVFLLLNRGPVISCQKASNVYVGFCNFFLRRKRVVFREASTLTSMAATSRFMRCLKVYSMRFAYRYCSWVIANSEDTREDLSLYSIVPSSKCKVIGNPVIPRKINSLRNEQVGHKWFNREFKVILTVGRLEVVKDHDSIICAMKYLVDIDANYRLIIIGDGELKDNLVRKISDLGITNYVDFISFTENVFAYMNNVDVYVSTSLWEGFGNTIVEAMACDVPVVGFACPGGSWKLITEDPASNLILTRTVDDLVKGINCTTKRSTQKVKSPVAEKYHISKIFEKYIELIV